MIFKNTGSFLAGFTIGFGTGFFSRELLPRVAEGVRPLTKGSVKFGIKSLEKFREGIATLGETLSDLTEEVKVELKEARFAPGQAKASKKHRPSRKRAHEEKTATVLEMRERSA